MTRKSTTTEFVRKAQSVHNNKYNYFKVNYVRNKNKVIIICKKHGEFLQSPSNHLKGKGCPECKRIKCSDVNKINTKEFIKRAMKVHGDAYNYSKVKYIKSQVKVIIICSVHGKFEQLPNNHLLGKGCVTCGGSKKLTKEGFIKKAVAIHGNKFNYSKVDYNDFHSKVVIICNQHGMFVQTPSAHIYQKQGCSKCSKIVSKPEIEWLNSLNISKQYRQKRIVLNGKNFFVDGFDPDTNTIFEYYGDYWHGNPKIYNQNDIHPLRKCTYGEIYKRTIERENILKEAGYNLVTLWESDWRKKYVNNKV